MPGISRDNDTAGGDLIPSQTSVYANNELVIVDGDSVASHGDAPHNAPTMIAGSANVYIGTKLVVNANDKATCNHVSTGSGDVIVGDIADAVAAAMGFESLSIDEDEAREIQEGREVEEAAGVDPDSTEAVEYGDGGISSARRSNTSPTNGVSGAQPAPGSTSDGTTESPSPQPSNEDGQYIKWLPHVDSRVKPEVVQGLEGISQQVGYQLQVTSGYRSPEYNANVGGAKRSQHMEGNATDIVQTGLTEQQRKDFIQAAIDNGFTAIGIYNTFTHIDIRGAKVAWGSNGSRTSLPNYPWALEVLRANGYPY
jgi:uncharacterized Zn-binding protein involved in type VI secretion